MKSLCTPHKRVFVQHRPRDDGSPSELCFRPVENIWTHLSSSAGADHLHQPEEHLVVQRVPDAQREEERDGLGPRVPQRPQERA